MVTSRRETRRDSRQRLRFQVRVGRTSCFTLNVSAGGFCTEVMRVLPVGSDVAGSIRVQGKDYPFSGRVAWAKEGNSQMNLRGRMGITLEPAPAELLRAVATAHSQPSGSPVPPARKP